MYLRMYIDPLHSYLIISYLAMFALICIYILLMYIQLRPTNTVIFNIGDHRRASRWLSLLLPVVSYPLYIVTRVIALLLTRIMPRYFDHSSASLVFERLHHVPWDDYPMRSEHTSPSVSSSNDASTQPPRAYDPQDHLSDLLQVPTCEFRPEDRLRDSSRHTRTPDKVSPPPEGPYKAPSEPITGKFDLEPFVVREPPNASCYLSSSSSVHSSTSPHARRHDSDTANRCTYDSEMYSDVSDTQYNTEPSATHVPPFASRYTSSSLLVCPSTSHYVHGHDSDTLSSCIRDSDSDNDLLSTQHTSEVSTTTKSDLKHPELTLGVRRPSRGRSREDIVCCQTPVLGLSESANVPKATTITESEFERLKVCLSSYSHSHNEVRDGNLHCKSPVSCVSKPDNISNALTTSNCESKRSRVASRSDSHLHRSLCNGNMRSQSPVGSMSESDNVPKVSTLTPSKYERLKSSLSSYSRSRRAVSGDNSSCKTLASVNDPGNTPKASTTSKGKSVAHDYDPDMQPHSHLRSETLEEVSQVYPSAYSGLREEYIDPKVVSNASINVPTSTFDFKECIASDNVDSTSYLPYAPNTTMYSIDTNTARNCEYMPASAALTSIVREDKLAHAQRKLFRRLGRDIYHLGIPTPEENRFPSRSCEVWAMHIFDLLDTVVTFRPTCLITSKLIPAQEIGYWPEYGELHIAFAQLIERTVTRRSARDALLPIPEWPATECLFPAEAFAVAAVCYRDQMERCIQKLYDLITTIASSPGVSIEKHEPDNVDHVSHDLRDHMSPVNPDSPSMITRSYKA